MNLLSQIFSHYYAVPFAIALFVRGRPALAATASAAAALAVWASFADGSHRPLLVIVVTFAGGLLSGARARAMFTSAPQRRQTALAVALTSSLALLLLPGSLAAEFGQFAHSANVTLRQWETRAPSEDCFSRKYAVRIAGANFQLPAAPILTIRARQNSYHFQFNRDVRSLCEQAQEAGAPMQAENLNLDFGIPMRGPFCATARSGWRLELCSHEPLSPPGAYPVIANIYAAAEYDRGHLMDAHSYADFVKLRNKASAAGHPFEVVQAGIFERYANGYWVARKGTWANDAGEPFTLHCGDGVQAGILNCGASYLLKSGPRLTYHFNAPGARLEAVAREVDRNLHSMITEFSTR